MASKPSGGEQPLDDLSAMFKAVPWWIGPITITAVYAAFQWVIPGVVRLIESGSDAPTKISDILGPISKMISPVAAGLITVVWLAACQKRGQTPFRYPGCPYQ